MVVCGGLAVSVSTPEVRVFEFRRQRRSVQESSPSAVAGQAAVTQPGPTSSASPSSRGGAAGNRPTRREPSTPRELPDVTGFLVVVLVTLGLFVVPVGATIMQGPAIVASLLGK